MLFELYVRCPCYKYSKLKWGGGGEEVRGWVQMGSRYEVGQENMSFFIIEHEKSNKNVFEIFFYEFENLSIS